MKNKIPAIKNKLIYGLICFLLLPVSHYVSAQTLAFPGADGFGRFTKGARGAANPSVYVVTNLNDKGPGSFRDAVSQSGRFVVFAVGGVIHLETLVQIAPNVTIAGQTAPGDGIVLFNKRVTFSGSSNTICRYLRIRLGATNNNGQDASGISNGANIILDHLSVTWGMDEVFSINWDNKGTPPDNITIQNSIIGQGLHRDNHSAGGLIQTPDGGKVSLIRNLYMSNKTRNPKVKGVNEFVNNVVYNWGNAGNTYGHTVSGDAYIMGGSAGISEVNILNNYFVGGPLTPASKTTPFSRGTGTFSLYGDGNYFDNDRNGALNGTLVPYNDTGYPGISGEGFKTTPFPYPMANPTLTAEQAYQWVIDSVGAIYPRRDQVDLQMLDDVKTKGTSGIYLYRETDNLLSNGGLGEVYGAPAPADSDQDGMPDDWETAHGLNKNDPADAVIANADYPEYFNIEVYINSLVTDAAPVFMRPPSSVALSGSSVETPPSSTVIINWQDNSDNEDHFIIERSLDGNSYAPVTTTGANVVTYTDATGLTPNTTYYYRIRGVNATDTSSYTPAVSIKTPPIPAAPEIPASPSPANGSAYVTITDGKAILTWSGSDNTITYSVYSGPGPDALTKLGDIPYSAAPSYQLSGLANSTTYYWRVDALNDKGETTGETWSFTTETIFPKEMIGYWSFDDTEGRQITDSSSFENHGVLGLDDDDQSIRITGKKNGALDFSTADPSIYVVSVPNEEQTFLDKSSFSISFWMKASAANLPQDNNSSAYLLCKGSITSNAVTGATGKRFDIEFKNKQLRFAIDDANDANGGGKDELQADATSFFNDEWVHVTVIRDTTEKKLKLYRNGEFVKESTIAKALSGIGEASALIIGNIGELEFLAATNQPSPYKGSLDELKIFNYVLTPEEIMALYDSNPSTAPVMPKTPSPATNAQVSSTEVTLSWTGGANTTGYKLYAGTAANALSFVADIPLSESSYTYPVTPGTTYFWRIDAVNDTETTEGAIWSFSAITAANPAPTDGLIGYWSFDETNEAELKDRSEYASSGLLLSADPAARVPGKRRNALDFSPSDTIVAPYMVKIPNKDHLFLDQGSFSFSFWMNAAADMLPQDNNSSVYLLCKGSIAKNDATGATGNRINIECKNKQLRFNIDDDSKGKDEIQLDGIPFFTGEWVHVVTIYDSAARKLMVYNNGVLIKEQTVKNAFGGYGENSAIVLGNIGELEFDDPIRKNAPAPYRGLMDEVKLFNRVLTPEEILNEYNLPAPAADKPYSPTPSNGATVNKKNVTLSWLNGETVTGYKVYLGTSADVLSLAATLPGTQTSYKTELEYNQEYFWRVDVEGGSAGDIWSFTTSNDFPVGLVGQWSFDETSGSVLTDSTRFKNHGVLTLNDPALARITDGYKKNALDFASSETDKAMAVIPDDGPISFSNSSFTFAFWVKGDAAALPQDNNSSAYLLCKGSISANPLTGATGNRINIELKNKQLRFTIDDNSKGKDEMQVDGTPFFTGEWVHVAAIYDSADRKLVLYRNAELVKEQAVKNAYGNFGESSALVLGNVGELELLKEEVTPAPFKGQLDEFKIFNFAFQYIDVAREYFGGTTPQKPADPSYNGGRVEGFPDTLRLTWKGGVNTDKYEVYVGHDPASLELVKEIPVSEEAVYAIPDAPVNTNWYWRVDAIGPVETVTGDLWSFSTGFPKGLVAHYTFNEPGIAADSSEYANHGTATGLLPEASVTGRLGEALDFGKNESPTAAIVVPDAPQINFDEAGFTVSLWVDVPAYDAANPVDAFLFHKGNVEDATGKWYGLEIKDKNLVFSVSDGVKEVSAVLNVATNSKTARNLFGKGWTHITVLRRPGIDRLQTYINGVLALSYNTSGGGLSAGNAHDLLIGNSSGNRPFPYAMDDIRIYNYELSVDEMTKLAEGTPLLLKPVSPTPAMASTGSGPEKVDLSWTDPTQTAESYNIFFGPSPDSLQLLEGSLTTALFAVDSLQPSSDYFWRVQAVSGDEKVMGNLWSFQTGIDITPPTAVTRNFSIKLNTDGEATLVADSLNDESHDEYGIAALEVDKSLFDCHDLGENTVTLKVTDNYGNEAEKTAIVTVIADKPAKPAILVPGGLTICYGDRFELLTEGVELATTYKWVYKGALNNKTTTSANKNLLAFDEGSYQLIARSAQTCESDTSDAVIISYSADTSLTISPSAEVSVKRGASAELTTTGSAGSITWSPDIGINTLNGPVVSVSPNTTTRYVATLTTPLGCKIQRTKTVTVNETFDAEYNKLLTPNGDGINDWFRIKNLEGYPNNSLQIFDGAGKLIYQKNGYNNDWNGRVNGRIVNNGTYYFILMIEKEVKIKGSITIAH